MTHIVDARLGAFGWASPPNEKTIHPNVGLYDVRAALQWTQNHIHKFGGDAADITVFGESAGGGIIMHPITAHGGTRSTAFSKGQHPWEIVASTNGARLGYPAIARLRSYERNLLGREELFKQLMAKANCSDLACLRHAPTQALIEANTFLIQNGSTAGVGFTAVVDGDTVPDIPSRLVLEGRYHKTLTSVVVVNNVHEVCFVLSALLFHY
jgi:carboxylesterase type B